MSQIKINNLTFSHDVSTDYLFKDLSFSIDSNWKIGLIGRNGMGKTTLLKLFAGKYDYQGSIISDLKFDYFPFIIQDKCLNVYELALNINEDYEKWRLDYELNLLNLDEDKRNLSFNLLSGGEKTKVMLGILFSKDNNFLLIDEPTNHLDEEGRIILSNYLNNKIGYILVSHDRSFLDGCIDHVIVINNNSNIEIQGGNYSSWFKNKEQQDNYELAQKEKLENTINKLNESKNKLNKWSAMANNNAHRDGSSDSRSIGFKTSSQSSSARFDRVAKQKEKLIQKANLEKNILYKNAIEIADLSINALRHNSTDLIILENLNFNNIEVIKDFNLIIKQNERVFLEGKNGCGKTTLIKILIGEIKELSGIRIFASNLKISYVSQDINSLSGSLKNYANAYNLPLSDFLNNLRKLGFKKADLLFNISVLSDGQKKKIQLARSICEEAHLYIWDEPLNYLDVFSRMQIENMILRFNPTLIIVEHDLAFKSKIKSKIIKFGV